MWIGCLSCSLCLLIQYYFHFLLFFYLQLVACSKLRALFGIKKRPLFQVVFFDYDIEDSLDSLFGGWTDFGSTAGFALSASLRALPALNLGTVTAGTLIRSEGF